MRNKEPEHQADLAALQQPFRAMAYKLKMRIDEEGLPLRVYETFRSPMRQARLFIKGRRYDTALKKWVVVNDAAVVTAAGPFQSAHEYGQAADFVLNYPGKEWQYEKFEHVWEEFGALAKSLGLVWGGDFKRRDMPHVEYFPWRKLRPANWKELQQEALKKALSLWPDDSVSG